MRHSLIPADGRQPLSGVHGFKYGEPWCAEFNYSSNVKPRSANKICAIFSLQIVGGRGAPAASKPAHLDGCQSAVDRESFLPLAISPAVA
jgi:hypothetical protein